MKKLYLGIVAGLALAGTAYADTKESYETTTKGERSSDGSYSHEKTTEATDSAGTTRKVEINEHGSTKPGGPNKVSMESKTTTDPKGLMNKTTTENEVYRKSDAKGNYKSEESNRVVGADSNEFNKEREVKRVVKSDGSVETTAIDKVSNDPRGLLNRSTGEVETKTVEHPDGHVSTTTTKEINGKVVEETTR